MDYGSRLKYFRNQAKMSANALAKKVSLDPTTIYKIEANDSKPSLGSLERMCDSLGITLSDFFAEDKSKLDPDLWRLLDTVKKLTPKQRDYLQKLLDAMGKD